MKEPAQRDDLASQVQQHLASLRSAGVEWLPLRTGDAATVSKRVAAAAAPAPAMPALGALFDSTAEAAAAIPADERRRELTVLAHRVAGCTRCAELVAERTQTVFGVGPVDPELCFVGEGPGFNEDQQGEPFVGDAGQLLNKIIVACGMTRAEVYICNIVKCRPPGNRTPTPEEAGHCREYLERQLELVRPKFICALGACAAQNLLESRLPIGRMRGTFHNYKGIPVLCTYHPAYLLRSPDKKRDVWEDMKRLVARMGRTLPPQPATPS